jgi:hypothetical protein
MAAKKKAAKGGSRAMTKTGKNELAPEYDYGSYKGQGYEETTQDDFAIPYLNLLQSMSPEVGAEGEDAAVEGAKPGMMINTVTQELYDGKQGLVFVPVGTQHVYVEWRPREAGGGIVGRHAIDSELVQACKASGEFGELKTEEGNDLVETFYMYGYMLEDADSPTPGQPMIVSFWSTKIKVYKRIMQTLRTYKGRPPLFANRLLIQTTSEKNNHGAFFNYKIQPLNGGVGESLIPPMFEDGPHPLLEFGQLLLQQIRSGERRAADESLEGQDGAPVDEDGNPLF